MMLTTYKFRFLVLLSFCVVNAANAILWISFAPLNTMSQAIYGVSAMEINALSICFLALYLPGTLLSMYVFNRFSLRVGLIVGSIMTMIGAWIRFGASPNYGAVLFGQCLAGLAQPFFTNIPAKVASRWFPVRERDLATVVGSMSNPIGIAIGTLVGTEFVLPSQTLQEQEQGMKTWLLVQALIATVGTLLVLGLFRDRPQTPASLSQEATVFQQPNERQSFALVCLESWGHVKRCFGDRSYCFLFAAFGLGLGMFNSLTTLVEQITRPSCATASDASTFGGLLIGIGLVGAGLVGLWLDRSHRYQLAIRLGFGLGFVLTLALTLALQPNLIDLQSALFALLGLVMLPMLPTAFSCAAETTFPVPEDVSSGLLMTSGQLTGIAFIFGLGELIPQPTAEELAVHCNGTSSGDEFTYPGSSILLIVIVGLAFLCTLGVQNKHSRLEVDEQALLPKA